MKINHSITIYLFIFLLEIITISCTKEEPKVIPILSTNQVSSITATSAVSGGTITTDGGANITSKGICWSTNQSPTTIDGKIENGAGSSNFISSITGLSPGITYYIRAFAINIIGTAYGNQITFITPAILPVLTTTETLAVTSNSATSGGNITSDGGSTITARGVCWGINQNPTTADNKTENGMGTGIFSSSISGISPGQTYYIRAYATNSVGTAYGNQITLSTPAILPLLTTIDATSVTSTTAISGGNITNDGGAAITTRGVCWSLNHNPTTTGNKTENGVGIGIYTSSISGLSPGKTYYIRAYATNSIGTAYGNQITAMTPAVIPIVSTTPASGIASTTANSGGNITSDGGSSITARGVCWSLNQNPTTANSKTENGSGSGSFSSSLTGLSPTQTYYIRAYAINSIGTSYGNQISITTTEILPELNTIEATAITSSTATSGGNITNDGGSAITSRGVCWSTSTSPSVSNSKTIDGSGTGSYNSSITGLTPGTKYYVRAYMTNNNGTYYGPQISFTTSYFLIEGSLESIQHLQGSGNFVFRLNNLTNKDVYFIFSNKNNNSTITLPTISGDITSMQTPFIISNDKNSKFVISGRESVSNFNNNPWKYVKKEIADTKIQQNLNIQSNNYVIGTSENFTDYDTGNSLMSTVRKVVSANGKNLYVWVDDACWGETSTKAHYITQTMVDDLSAKFLNSGTNDDIYEWVTNIIGEPWGPTIYNNLITNTEDIHIWLADIENDNSTNGGVVGYFWGGNNFFKSSVSKSNEKLMFVIDAVLFSTPTGISWENTDYWPKTVVSTLSHEFQHMVYYYQKTIKQSLNDVNSAVNEMSSQCIEDLIANKISSNGPRGVAFGTSDAGNQNNTSGRLPRYNNQNYYTLLDWSENDDEVYLNYSKTYALGAYLMRNYGGANFIKQIVQNGYTGINCIINAVNSNGGGGISYENILTNFGAANLLSNNTTLPTGYKFNSGTWFTSTVNSINYQLGSINLFNYNPNPLIFPTLPLTQKPGSNLYYLLGTNLSGTTEWLIKGLNNEIKITVVIK